MWKHELNRDDQFVAFNKKQYRAKKRYRKILKVLLLYFLILFAIAVICFAVWLYIG